MRRLSVVLLLVALAGAGCARGVGPRSLPWDRTAYVEALGDSWKDQVLYNIVKLRYGDAPTYLDVTQIVQAYQLQTGANASYSYGWKPLGKTKTIDNTTGNTITESNVWDTFKHGVTAGISGQYQNSPTITYQPISGDALKESLLKPIPLEDLCRALETGWDPEFMLPHVVQSINTLQNKPEDQEFLNLVQSWKRLLEVGALQIVFEEVKEVKAPEMRQNEEPTGKADKWGESAENLAKFTSKLVKEQDKQSEEKTKAPFIILNRDRARKHDIEAFKTKLGLVSDPKELTKKAKGLLNPKSLDEKDKKGKEKVKNWLKKEIGLNDQQINNNEKEIGGFLGLISTGFTPQDQENLKSQIMGEAPPAVERYQVVYGVPPGTTGLSKIYFTTKSVTQVLMMLSNFVEVPPSHVNKVYGKDENNSLILKKKDDKYKQWFDRFPHLTVSVIPGDIRPDILTKPDEFAAVKYKGYWFYVPDNDRNSKDILSSMIGIFTMMPAGKKEAPVLTLPVR
jgi:hypothetical protein